MGIQAYAQIINQTTKTSFAFTHVNVIDVKNGTIKKDMTVVVNGNRITAVGKKISVPKNAQLINASGKYLIPGLWDMHTHSREDTFARKFIFPLDIANGITAVRDMNGDCVNNCNGTPDIFQLNQWRKEIAKGILIGPRIYAASSPLIDGEHPFWHFAYSVKNAAEARKAVHFFKDRGVDFLKVYSGLSREAYFALADEAKKINMVFAGHVPVAVSVLEASNAGQKSLEHMHGMQEGCSTLENELRAEILDSLQSQFKREGKSHLYPFYISQAKKAFATYDPVKAKNLFAAFVKNKTWIVPTLIDKDFMSKQVNDPASILNDPNNKYAPLSIRYIPDKILKGADAESKLLRIERYKKMVTEMQHAGVGILAGTDMALRNPGFSLHSELALFVEGGMTPQQALQTATISPAHYFNTDQFGTIEKGKFADLVLLDANPLVDIHNTQKINSVVANGRYFSRKDLDKLLADVEAFANKK